MADFVPDIIVPETQLIRRWSLPSELGLAADFSHAKWPTPFIDVVGFYADGTLKRVDRYQLMQFGRAIFYKRL